MRGLNKQGLFRLSLVLLVALLGAGVFYYCSGQTLPPSKLAVGVNENVSSPSDPRPIMNGAGISIKGAEWGGALNSASPTSKDISEKYFFDVAHSDSFYGEILTHNPELARYVLRLNSRAFLPLPLVLSSKDKQATLLAEVFETQASSSQTRRMYLQFKEHPTQAQRQALSALGVELETYVTAYAWSASGTRPAFEAALQLACVQALACIDPRDKLLPGLYQGQVPSFAQLEDGRARIWVLAQPRTSADDFAAALKSLPQTADLKSKQAYQSSLGLQFEVAAAPSLAQALSKLDAVAYVEFCPPPAKSRDSVTDESHNINDVRDVNPFLDGADVTVAVREVGKPSAHVSFANRLTYTQDGSSKVSADVDHATGVAGLIAGNGTSGPKGVAPAASVLMYAVTDNASDVFGTTDVVAAAGKGARISNHSYGPSSDFGYGEYRTISADWDNGIRANNLVGFFANAEAYGLSLKSTDYFVGAKNTICVNSSTAAAHAFDADPPTPAANGNSAFNGKGTMNDGRIKPDLTAYGENVSLCQGLSATQSKTGTSFSTPTCTGAAALISQHYFNKTATYPSAALMKALLCNSATDLGVAGPDPYYGFGLLNVEAAVNTVDQRLSASVGPFFEDSVSNGETRQFTATVSGSAQFKATLCWLDVGGNPLVSTPALVNDLDLEITGPEGVTLYPYSLNATNPAVAATNSGPNTVDPIEQTVIDKPTDGNYTILVRGRSIPSGTQAFAVVLNQASTPQPLAAKIVASPTSGDAPLAVLCSGSSSTGSISSFTWDFGDGSTAGSGAQVAHIYNTVNNYTVTLTVKDINGKSSVATQIIQVNPPTVNSFAERMSLNLNFKQSGKDSLLLSLVVPSKVRTGQQIRDQIKANTLAVRTKTFKGDSFTLNINGLKIETFTTDVRGNAKNKTASFTQNMARGEITIQLKSRSDLQVVFKALNLSSDPASAGDKEIPVTIVDGTLGVYTTMFRPAYKVKNLNGTAKQ